MRRITIACALVGLLGAMGAIPATASDSPLVPDGALTFRNVSGGNCIKAMSSSSVYAKDCDTSSVAQQWTAVKLDHGQMKLRSVERGSCLTLVPSGHFPAYSLRDCAKASIFTAQIAKTAGAVVLKQIDRNSYLAEGKGTGETFLTPTPSPKVKMAQWILTPASS